MNPIDVALSLMKEAVTLLDEPEAETIVLHLRLAIDAAERTNSSPVRDLTQPGINQGDSDQTE